MRSMSSAGASSANSDHRGAAILETQITEDAIAQKTEARSI
jgi:hypothetical protein